MDINPTRTLQYQNARAADDERHICPLQLDVIERAMQLWTAPDDVVFSPFTGIGMRVALRYRQAVSLSGLRVKRVLL